MLFVDPVYFLLFLPLVTLLFYQLRRRTLAVGYLAVVSFLFYAGFGRDFLLIFVASIAINAGFAFWLMEAAGAWRRRLFAAGMLFNIGYIFYFKYWWYLGSFGAGAFDVGNLAIPVGISFYTFQQMGFLFDLYSDGPGTRGLLQHAPNWRGRSRALTRYVAYVAFFPQLVIGPIVYLKEYISQIDRPRFGRLRQQDLAVGITLLVLGLAKKVFADWLGSFANPAFDAAAAGEELSRFTAWVGVCAYYLQLYFDFSGYSDMALGAARLVGIRLPINFDSPLRACGIRDFYQRWHITLTRLIARFMFTPLSLWGTRRAMRAGHRRGWRFFLLSSWLPLLINFQIIAIWHGLSPTFLLFGLIHGIWFVLESDARLQKRWRGWFGGWNAQARFYFGAALTFLPLMLTFALFRSQSLEAFGYLLERLLFLDGAWGLQLRGSHLLIGVGFAIVWLLPNTNLLLARYQPGFITFKNADRSVLRLRWQPTLLWALGLMALFYLSLRMLNFEAPFLYLGF